MTSDDVSVIWKSAFPLQWAEEGGGDAHGEQSKSRQERRRGNKRGRKELPVVFDVKRTTRDTKSAQNTP